MGSGPRRSDGSTEARPDAIGYARSIVRQRPEVHWQDATGAHTASLEGVVVAGASDAVELVVHDPSVSRLHAELEQDRDGLWVRDLGSTNGTFVQGVRVRVACVPDGGVIRLGGTDLHVRYAASTVSVPLWPLNQFGPLVGQSAVMRELFARLAAVAASGSTVLVQGETGTGKELVARAIHDASPRARQPFVTVDCAALPEGLLEGELFGHARGAFTGAVEARPGAIESADGGTVFLDEVGELPLAVQPKLLRAIESRAVRRLGETGHRTLDVRFVAATHRDLRSMVNAGAFREDLYFRLAVLPVTVPPLRARLEDIPLLVERFVPQGAPALDRATLAQLGALPWLGNVRELRNVVERAAVFGAREALASMPPGIERRASAPATAPGAAGAPGPDDRAAGRMPAALLQGGFKDARERCIEQFEREYLEALLARHGRNVAAAAQEAGLDKSYVHRLVRRHEV